MQQSSSGGSGASLFSLSGVERHEYILKTYVLNRNTNSKHKRDIDVIKENHRFLWDDEEEVVDTWEARLARRYYDKLFREYCIADLTRFKENKIALRWRTEAEVVTGKGQFQCGCRRCEETEGLRSWEVNFAYQENGERKNALVKVRLCPEHSEQLNFTSRKREIKRLKHTDKQQKRNRHKQNKSKCNRNDLDEVATAHDTVSADEGNNDEISSAPEVDSEIQKTTDTDDGNQQEVEDENVWSKKPDFDLEPTSRETDFERYLEDLLL